MKIIRALVMSIAALVSASAAAEYEAGVDYRVLDNPVRTSQTRIEVTEFFWYGCGHCYNFEPYFNRFKENAAEDVRVGKSPAMWAGAMRAHAKMYYAMSALGATDAQHQEVFKAISIERRRMTDVDEMADFVADLGLDGDRYTALYNSFPVDSQVRMADSRQRQAGVTGTPQVMVAGKYVVGSTRENPLTFDQMLAVVEHLVEKERTERAN